MNCMKLKWKGPEIMWEKAIDPLYEDHSIPFKRMAEALLTALYMENTVESLTDFEHYNQLHPNSLSQDLKQPSIESVDAVKGSEEDDIDKQKPIKMYDLDREWIDDMILKIISLLYGHKDWKYIVSLGNRYNKERGEQNETILKYMKYSQNQIVIKSKEDLDKLNDELNEIQIKYQDIQV